MLEFLESYVLKCVSVDKLTQAWSSLLELVKESLHYFPGTYLYLLR
jgi:hypothetical protein